jgi:spermidine/putrescine-binding protein
VTHLSYEEMQRRRYAADRSVTRRSLLVRGGGALVAMSGLPGLLAACGDDGGAASGGNGEQLPEIREIGLSLTEDPRILGAYKQQTGNTVVGRSDNLGNQITFWKQNNEQFQINQVNFNQNGAIADTIRNIPATDIPAWNDKVVPLFREPDVPGYAESGWPIAGTYTQAAIDSGSHDELIGVPTWYGFDAFGYLNGKAKGDLESYGAIFDPANRGRATLLNEPITSVMKVATYLQGTGQADFQGPINNLTRSDLDTVFEFLTELKRAGQFRLFWSDFGQLVDLLTAGEVHVGDFWASAVAAARQNDADAVFVNDPAEGSNGWIQGATISKAAGNRYEAATAYVNWFLDSGVPGQVLGLQGYYSPRQDRVKPLMEETNETNPKFSDWEYWYEGAVPDERPSLETRLEKVADWQAYPDEFGEYSARWTRFTSA